jgi:MYXO-CTERM domain-containing protein
MENGRKTIVPTGKVYALTAGLALALASMSAQAELISGMHMTVAVDGVIDGTFDPGPALPTGDPSIFQVTGSHVLDGVYSIGDDGTGYNGTVDIDQRRLSLVFGIANLDTVEHRYTVYLEASVDAVLADAFMTGIVSGSVNDANFDGDALITGAGGPAFTALVDGSTAMELLDPLSVAIDEVGAGDTFGDDMGIPPGTLPGPTGSLLAIEIDFTLSPGDIAGFNSSFLIIGTPAPGGLALLAVAGLLGTRRRRH